MRAALGPSTSAADGKTFSYLDVPAWLFDSLA